MHPASQTLVQILPWQVAPTAESLWTIVVCLAVHLHSLVFILSQHSLSQLANKGSSSPWLARASPVLLCCLLPGGDVSSLMSAHVVTSACAYCWVMLWDDEWIGPDHLTSSPAPPAKYYFLIKRLINWFIAYLNSLSNSLSNSLIHQFVDSFMN